MFDLTTLIIGLPIILITITIHEYAHAKVADMLGDPTPRLSGRLSLNPIVHIDPIGLLMLVLVRFGWAKPVPVNQYNFREPTRDMALVGFAGPAANFFTAWALAMVMRFIPLDLTDRSIFLLSILGYCIWINLALGLFNLIPVPPLDGSRILPLFLPPRYHYYLTQLETHGFIILLIILIFPGTSYLLVSLVNFLYGLLT